MTPDSKPTSSNPTPPPGEGFPVNRLALLAALGGVLGAVFSQILLGLPVGDTPIGTVIFYAVITGAVTWAVAGILLNFSRSLFPASLGARLAIGFCSGIAIGAVAVVILYQVIGTLVRWLVRRA